MGKKISQITNEETTSISDTDVFEGEEAGGASFKSAFSVIKSTIKSYLDSVATTLTNKTLTTPTIGDFTNATHDHTNDAGGGTISASGGDGWNAYSAVIPTRASADDPTYVLTFAAVDITSIISVGMKIKWTQNSTVRYGIVTAISFSTNTTLTLYGGTDYDVDDTGVNAISDFYYSTARAPLSFPLDTTKWTVEVTDTTNRSQASPTQDQWYNLGSISITAPIGMWREYYSVHTFANKSSATNIAVWATLSNANNTEWDNKLTGYSYAQGASSTIGVVGAVSREKTLSFASKTTLYLNAKTSTAGATSIQFDNASVGAVIRLVCAYL